MWVGLIGNKLVGPHEFPERLNEEIYMEFLEEDLPDLLDGILTRHQQEDVIFMVHQHIHPDMSGSI